MSSLPHTPHASLRLPPGEQEVVEADQRLGLVTVRCPRCGRTVGILPGSAAWHARCGGARMRPVDPEAAAKLRRRRKMRGYMRRRRTRRGLTNGAENRLLAASEAAPRVKGRLTTPARPAALKPQGLRAKAAAPAAIPGPRPPERRPVVSNG